MKTLQVPCERPGCKGELLHLYNNRVHGEVIEVYKCNTCGHIEKYPVLYDTNESEQMLFHDEHS